MQYDLDELRQKAKDALDKFNGTRIDRENEEERAALEEDPIRKLAHERNARDLHNQEDIFERLWKRAEESLRMGLEEEGRRLAREREREPER